MIKAKASTNYYNPIGINIGNSAEAVSNTKDAILAILNTNTDQKTKRVALNCLSKGLAINGVNLNGVTVVTPDIELGETK